MPFVLSVAAIVITAIVGLAIASAKYNYMNVITWSHVSIGGDVGIDRHRVVKPTGERPVSIRAERVVLKCFGRRKLENVELHVGCPGEPAVMSITEASGISRRGVDLSWADDAIRMKIPTLKAGDELVLEVVRWGYLGGLFGHVQGTGHSYNVERQVIYEAKRTGRNNLLICGALVAYLIFVQVLFMLPGRP